MFASMIPTSVLALYLVLVFFSSFALAVILTPLTAGLAARWGFLDRPAPRRSHQTPTPRHGGIPLFIAFVAALAVSLPFPRSDVNEPTKLAGLMLGLTVVAIVGAYDDARELKALPQLAAQILAAGIAVASGVVIREIPSPVGAVPIVLPELLAIAFTLFWIVGMTNTINWLDGLDGLAAGVTAIASAVLFIHTFRLTQYSLALLPLALAGAALGFLIFNFSPAKMFLGSGAPLLGFALAVLSIIGGAKVATALLVLAIPILDVAWQILNRLRTGRSPFEADRGHLHHRLYDFNISSRAIVALYYALTAAFGALALILPSPVYKLIALIVIGIGALAVLIRLRKT
jgi:UDP-GlcNAc:undecaprenyl-phosphate/decaprenyl-phosphate GlcNAc-1-phosphate transferase